MTTISEQSNGWSGSAKIIVRLITDHNLYAVSYNAANNHKCTVYKTLGGAQKKYNQIINSMVTK